MRVSTVEQDLPYLAARGDNTGSFVEWLKTLNVRYPKDITIAQMVKWGWIRPTFRVVLPARYFLSWTDFPSYSSGSHEIQDEDVWADQLWYSAGAANGLLYRMESITGEWFVHPFDREGGALKPKVDELRKEAGVPHVTGQKHPNGLTFYPWIDYFPHWKAYELIEALQHAKLTGPIWLTDDISADLRKVEENQDLLISWRRAGLERVHKAWRESRTVFQHLAAYRAMRAALTFAPHLAGSVQTWEPKEAAKALAERRGITASDLEVLTSSELLVQAKEWWDWEKEDGIGPGLHAKGQLQKDIFCALEWLCLLTGKPGDDYYDTWSAPDREPRPTLPLADALPLDFRIGEEYFLDHFLACRGIYDTIPAPARFTENEIRSLVRALRKKTWLFVDWLSRYRSLHEGLGGPPKWDWAGVTGADLTHDLTLLPLFTEKALLDLAGSGAPSDSFKSLVSYLARNLEATDPRFLGAWQLASNDWDKYTNLKSRPKDPFGDLHALSLQGSDIPAAFAKALLFFGLARHYFAHHSYQHHKLIQTPEGGAIVSGIVTAMLYLAAPYCGIR